MNDDELRARIAASDPTLDDASVRPVHSAEAQTFLEAIMSTDLDTPTTAPSGGGGDHNVRSLTDRRARWPRIVLAAAAVAVVAVAGAAIGGVFDSGDDEPDLAVDEPAGELPGEELPVDDSPGDTPDPGVAVIELSAGDTDPMMMSCIRVDATIIAQSPTAFRGTVDSIEGEVVTLTVDQWYAGGDAPVVTITAPLGLEALTGSIDFVPGEPYLISAYDGVVSYCGMSGPATPELQSLYDEAFPT